MGASPYHAYDELDAGGHVRIVDLDDCPRSPRAYEGDSGPREAIRWRDRNWLVKYPESTRGMRGSVLPYTTGPVSEWLGSHVYAALGLPVHDTVLGHRRGRVVVACRDFCDDIDRNAFAFLEFQAIMNTDPEERLLPDGSLGSGRSVYLDDVLRAIATLPLLRETPGVPERFWDQFVVDALINNTDRNNKNWGVFVAQDEGGAHKLAPVYDNGNSFYNKRPTSAFAADLADAAALRNRALGGVVSAYRLSDGSVVRPFNYLARTDDADALAAVARLCDRADPAVIGGLVDSVPTEWHGSSLMPDAARTFHHRTLGIRLEALRARRAGS